MNASQGYEYIEKSEAEHQIDQMKPLLLHRTGADIACLVPFTTLDNVIINKHFPFAFSITI